ncbi:hypothetical protein [Streptomyces prunicolor]|uniref:hypothetical protein n=1 Tax=Streptomyces prunicolor TaxID=67348 RepID=UPI000374542D|nr:hypothetical protein [Streptomyces prunicolor]
MNRFETEFQTATRAVTAATEAASARIGDLLRDHLPTVATLLVDTDQGVVDSYYDSDGQPVSFNDFDLPDDVFDTVHAVLDQVLSLGKTSEALTRNGWKLTHPFPFAGFPVRTKTDDRT